MSTMVSLPMFDITVNGADLKALALFVGEHHPNQAVFFDSAETLSFLRISGGAEMLQQVEVLNAGIEALDLHRNQGFDQVAERARWLARDLSIAPRLVSDPIVLEYGRPTSVSNTCKLVDGAGVEWSSVPYLLGVLLSEMNRVENVDPAALAATDRCGVLRLDDCDIEDVVDVVRRAVDSIVFSDGGRDFAPMSQSLDNAGFSEVLQFIKLQEALAKA